MGGDGNSSVPRISVLLPVYNGATHLRPALASVLAQTFADFELVLIDDGSTDDTPAIVAEFLGDDRIVHHRQDNQGIVAALNQGLKLAKAPLVARMDADDVMKPDRLARQVAYLADHPELSGAGSDYELIDECGHFKGLIRSPLVTPQAVQAYLASNLPVVFPHPTMILSAAAVQEVGAYREEYRDSEDVDLFTRLLDAGRLLAVQPEALLSLRVHGGSVSAGAVRRQVMLNDLIVLNSARRRAGRTEIGVAEYAADHRSGMANRLHFERRLLRARLIRRATTEGLKGRRAAQLIISGSIALLGPRRAIGAAQRRVRRRLFSRRGPRRA